MYEKMLRLVCILTLGLLTSSVLVVVPAAEVAAEQADATPAATAGTADASATPTQTATAFQTEAVTATVAAPTALPETETPSPSPTVSPTDAVTPTPDTPTPPAATATLTLSPTISPTASATPTPAPPVPSTDEIGDDAGPENLDVDLTGARAAAVGAINSTLLVANPLSTTASITLSVRNPLGTEVYGTNTALTGTGVFTFTLPASLGPEFQGSALVSADHAIQALVLNSNAANSARDIYDGGQASSTSLTFPIFRHLGNDAQKSIIAVQNLDPSAPAIVTLHYYKPDGSEAAGSPAASVAVLPLASTYFDSFQLFGSSSVSYTARVESTKNIAGSEQISFKADTAALRGLTDADQGSQFYLDWLERKVLTSGAVTNWSEIYVRNQGSNAAQVKVTYYLPSGMVRTSEKKTIPPNGLGLYTTQRNRALGTGFAGYARVTQTGSEPLAVEWLEVNGGGRALYGFQGVASTQTSTRWACDDARRFTAAPAQKTKFKIINTSTTAAKAKVTLFDSLTGKATVTKSYSISPRVQLTVNIGGFAYRMLGKAFQGWALFESTNSKQLVVTAYSSYGTLGYTGYTCAPLPAASTNAYLPFVVRDWTHPVASPALPPDPVTVAPPLDPSIVTSVLDETAFLYSGSNPIQTGVTPGTIELQRVAVLRGRVLTRDGQPRAAVTISVLDHPEFGQTLTREDGKFDLAVNGGGVLTVQYAAQGLLTAQRQVQVPWQDYVSLPDVVLIALDPQVTAVDLTANTPIQVAQGSPVSDTDGSRQATVLVRQGTTASMTLPNGTTQPLSTMHIRATEFTVGANGPQAMPAELPPGTGYTYAVELSADEALAAGATGIAFNQALPFYVENFIGFPVGGIVPTGYYDRTAGKWIAAPNGRVIKVLSVTGGLADVDLDGTGVPANGAALAALGITDAERQQLAGLYQPGQSLWRVPIGHFSAYDHNWPYGPPDGSTTPDEENPFQDEVTDPCQSASSIISCETQTLGEDVPLVGTRYSLHYESDRHPGRKDARSVDV
ncbi:MAG: hypothetical protein ACM3JD_06345, partial [Rudaea sp.]